MKAENLFELQTQSLFAFDQEGAMFEGDNALGCPQTSTLTTTTTVTCPTG